MIKINLKGKELILDKNFYDAVIKDENLLANHKSKFITYDGAKLTSLVLEFNNISYVGKMVKLKTKMDFRLSKIQLMEPRVYPDYLIFTRDEISNMKFKKSIPCKKFGWGRHIYHYKNYIVFVFHNDRYGVEVHGIIDNDNIGIDITRITPKYDSHTRGYYLSYDEKRLHRELLQVSSADEQVDHINLICSDNRRENLRVVSSRENCLNQGLRRDSSTGTKGVCVERDSSGKIKKFSSEIRVHGKLKRYTFSVNKYGYNKAFEMAVSKRKYLESIYGYYTPIRQIDVDFRRTFND